MINVIFKDFNYEILPKRLELFDKYTKLIQWGRANPTRFIEDIFKIQLTDMQKYVLLSSWIPANITWVMARNSGKGTSLDTPVYYRLTDRGIKIEKKTVGDLKVGDMIYDETGNLTEVMHLNSIVIEDEYVVEFSDGEKISTNAEHIWKVKDLSFDKYNKYEDKWVLRNTEFLYDNFKSRKRNGGKDYENRFYVPLTKPVNYPKTQWLPIPPYLLGLWLGDGYSTQPAICGARDDLKEIQEYIKPMCRTQFYKELNRENSDCDLLFIDREKELKQTGVMPANIKKCSLLQKLKKLDLYNNKHIPEIYLYAPYEDRLALLQGLCDTDGTIDKKNGTCSFSQSNYEMCVQVQKLLASLGIKSTITKKKSNYIKKNRELAESWDVFFYTTKDVSCFRLKRKAQYLPDKLDNRHYQKAIVNIEKTGKKIPMRCITVSNKSGLFLCGNNYTVTHNSFLVSPFMMARALLLPNTNTYLMAPSGGQAQETFQKMEDIAKGNIASLLNTSSVFLDECVRMNSTADPFTHPKSGYTVSLYNGSTINSLNSVIKNIVGIRSSFSENFNKR